MTGTTGGRGTSDLTRGVVVGEVDPVKGQPRGTSKTHGLLTAFAHLMPIAKFAIHGKLYMSRSANVLSLRTAYPTASESRS